VNSDFGRVGKRSWPSLEYCLDTGLDGLRKSRKNCNQNSRSPSRGLKSRPVEYEAATVPTIYAASVSMLVFQLKIYRHL
jgi:hypothetical protein